MYLDAGVAPSWVYFLSGLAVLLYLHLDCLDGKQARRTKSSSPLGQLFDHGADSVAHLHRHIIGFPACTVCMHAAHDSRSKDRCPMLGSRAARPPQQASPMGNTVCRTCAGCDALSVHLITSQMAGTLALGDGPLVVIGTLAIMIPWFAAQWEEYHTGLMLCVPGHCRAMPPCSTHLQASCK